MIAALKGEGFAVHALYFLICTIKFYNVLIYVVSADELICGVSLAVLICFFSFVVYTWN